MPGKCGVRVRTIVVFLILLLAIVFMLPVASAATITVGQNRQTMQMSSRRSMRPIPGTPYKVYNDGFDYVVGELGLLVDKPVNIVGIGSDSGLPRISLSNGAVMVVAPTG